MFESSVEQTGGRWSINSITISKLLVVNLLTPRPDQTEYTQPTSINFIQQKLANNKYCLCLQC